MQKRVMFGVWLCSILLFVSCNGNYGYPGKVTFDATGGSQTVSGEECFYSLEITDYNGDGKSSDGLLADESDSLTVTYQWLTIRTKKFDNSLTIIAEPNNTGRKRQLYIAGWVDNSFADIKVVQTKY